tara:strand:+ start:88 stop:1827 length:1740 start_codon:yes stop_codon:yes gene_type:complete
MFFIISMQISNAIIINEIMADTIADESLNEWIELYNNEETSINVSSWIVGDDNDNDTIEGGLYNEEGTIIGAFGYAIITDEATRVYNNFNTSDNAVRLYVDDGAIGNGLINSGETIYLYDNNEHLIDKKTYNATTEDLSWAYLNESLHKADPSPGFANDESVIIDQGCDFAVEFILAKTVFDNSSEFSFKIRASKVSGQSTNFTMRAKIEDLNGKLMKEYKPFTNTSITKQRTSSEYTPNIEEGKSYFMGSNITTQCNDTNIENNFDTRLITIKGKPLQESSSIDIAKIYDLGTDKKAKFGQTIRIKLNAYKGNTNKKSIAVWIEGNGNRISKQSKTNLELKYTNYSLTLPIQIKPNCDEEFDDDYYIIVAKGLDSEDEEEVEIEDLTDDMCEIKIIESKPFSSKDFSFDIQNFNENIEANESFKTKIVLDNNNNQDVPIKLWSYVYSGSKSYSGVREENMKEIILKANSLHVVELSNMVDEADPGNYKLKVLVNKNNQKTNNELTKDIIINNKLKNDDIENSENENTEINNNNLVTANTVLMNRGLVYESTTQKAKNLIPIFLIILSVLINVVLIWKR